MDKVILTEASLVILTETSLDHLITGITNNVLEGVARLLAKEKETDIHSREWLSSKETQNLLKISSVTLWSWSKNGILKAHKISNRLRYRKDDVLKALIRKEPQI